MSWQNHSVLGAPSSSYNYLVLKPVKCISFVFGEMFRLNWQLSPLFIKCF